MLELPWTTRTEDNTDLAAARAVLDADHAGLSDVKDRILEYLAVRNRRAARGLHVVGGRGSGAVLALAGPPGVGKTSLGESVARALGRNFVRVSLGGVRDEAEIRGHRRTYVGALPGRIVRAIREAGSMNPVVLLDEVDKLSAGGFSGDPAAALLEVLDPAQNHTFRDHYLEIDLDLSDVLFLATANVVDTIPGPLLDRMELVTPGRVHRGGEGRHRPGPPVAPAGRAGRPHARGRVHRRRGARRWSPASTPGRRAYGSWSGRWPRCCARSRCGWRSSPVRYAVDVRQPQGVPGSAAVHLRVAERTAVPGVATGLAVTGAGGDVLFIEATAMDRRDPA